MRKGLGKGLEPNKGQASVAKKYDIPKFTIHMIIYAACLVSSHVSQRLVTIMIVNPPRCDSA